MEYMFTNTKQYIGNVTVFYYSYEEQFLRIQDPLLSPLCEHLPFLSSVPPGKFM